MDHRETTPSSMAFFWGITGEILFPGWPGSRTGMYVLALLSIFTVAVLVEWLFHRHLLKIAAVGRPRGYTPNGSGNAFDAVSHALIHALRIGLAYMVMLAVMSFNVGVLLTAVVGRAVGYLVFRSGVFEKRDCGMPPYERAHLNSVN